MAEAADDIAPTVHMMAEAAESDFTARDPSAHLLGLPWLAQASSLAASQASYPLVMAGNLLVYQQLGVFTGILPTSFIDPPACLLGLPWLAQASSLAASHESYSWWLAICSCISRSLLHGMLLLCLYLEYRAASILRFTRLPISLR